MKPFTSRLDRVLALGPTDASSDLLPLRRSDAFEQSPNRTLLATDGALRILAANDAMRRALGYTEKQLTQLSVSDIFQLDGNNESLLRQLCNPSPRLPIKARQRTRNGAALEMEVTGYRLQASGRTILAFIAEEKDCREKLVSRTLESPRPVHDLPRHGQTPSGPNRRLSLAAVMGRRIWQLSHLESPPSAPDSDSTPSKTEYLNLIQRLLELAGDPRAH